MPVTDRHVATLHALLSRNFDEYHRLRDLLDQETDGEAYTALVAAAFIEAVERRFPEGTPHTEIVEFVGALRATTDEMRRSVDPRVAERLIGTVSSLEPTDDIETHQMVSHQMMILGGLIADERLEEAEVAERLASARKLADQLMA